MKIRFFMKNGTVSPDFECAKFIVHQDVWKNYRLEC